MIQRLLVILAAAAVLALPGLARAAPEMTATDVETFVDGWAGAALVKTGTPGLSVAVVRDGAVLFEKGYGVAEVASGRPMSPTATLTRIGSVSKTFAWVSVMQLHEQGRLDLDRDLNAYLDFRIPGPPISLRRLMTHTAGFEDTTKDHYPADSTGMTLGGYVKAHLPKRLFAPGERTAYSNYGATLASYVVERVSGEPYEAYVRRHILTPLGMQADVSLDQPPAAALRGRLARSYQGGGRDPDPFIISFPVASGGVSATADAMTRFMLALLGRGQAQILKPETAALMFTRQVSPAPGFNGFTLGFGEQDRNGVRIVGHGGSTTTFFTDMMLLPGEGIGLFVAVNGNGVGGSGKGLPGQLNRAIVDRYFPPAPLPVERTVASAAADAEGVAGDYLWTRRTESSFRFLQLLTQAKVSANGDGTISISMLKDEAGRPKRWREIAPLTWREVGGADRVRFIVGKDGRVLYWSTDAFPPVMLFEPATGLKGASRTVPLLGLSLAALALGLVVWGVGALVARHYGRPLVLSPGDLAWRRLGRIGSAVLLASVVGWLALGAWAAGEDRRFSTALEPAMYGLYVLSVLGLLGAVAVVGAAVRVWRGARPGTAIRLGETLLAAAALFLAAFTWVFGLVGFSVRF